MKKRLLRPLALFLAFCLIFQMGFPTVAWALTGGPSQPEVENFHPIGATDMVDLFSGDFSYNIPLLDVDGYPINISYHSGISMDQEASWVGLGWNINPGVVNRNMRGIPDDFNGEGEHGDVIDKELNIKPNRTYGVSAMVSPEFFGVEASKGKSKAKPSVSFGLGVSYNTYTGFGFEPSVSASISVSNGGKTENTSGLGLSANLKSSNIDGLTIQPEVSFSQYLSKHRQTDNFSVSAGFNSRAGLKSLNFGISTVKKPKPNFLVPVNKQKKRPERTTNGGSSITFGMETYVPDVSMPMINSSVMFSPKFGAGFFGVDALYSISAYYSEQKLEHTSRSQKAYGFFNTEYSLNDAEALLDFNREKDGSFTTNTPRLPITNFSYDLFTVSGQGIGGMFKPSRGEIGYVFDASLKNKDNSYSLGVDLAGGNLVKGGADLAYTRVRSANGKWTDDNLADDRLPWKGKTNGDLYEPCYFKEAGEKSVDTDQLFDKIGGTSAVSIDLVEYSKLRAGAKAQFYAAESEDTKFDFSGVDLSRSGRKKRNQDISFLTNEKALKYGLGNYVDRGFPKHHIGEITATRDDGTRYVYGRPVYNFQQIEATFSTGNGVGDDLDENQLPLEKDGLQRFNGLVTYRPGIDNSVGNKHGIDNYFNKTTLHNYAHSYLLTTIVSPDYVDNDGVKGPSIQDMGSYTLFNYSDPLSFNWRMPMGTSPNQANADEKLKSVHEDDQANYLYGEKEVVYLSTIESKNYIAVFETGPRVDGLGVLDENGGLNTSNPPKLLKSITLYLKKDYDVTAQTGQNPIKKVYFEYDYSLCPNVENNVQSNPDRSDPYAFFQGNAAVDGNNFPNQGGKLTLKKIYFEYGSSKLARFSPYEFTYCQGRYTAPELNPAYQSKAVDRWGVVKPFKNDFRDNSDFPYTPQERIPSTSSYYDPNNPTKTWEDVYATAWHLTQIRLPSGGEIQIDYESDDYAYVQNIQAMQMFKVTGMSTEDNVLQPKLYDADSHTNYNRLHFSCDAFTDQEVAGLTIDDLTKDIHDLYFRFLVNLSGPGEGRFEYVPGYAQVVLADNGKISGNFDPGSKTGWIDLETSSISDKTDGEQVSSIAKAAWQFSRLYTPQYAFGSLTATSDIGDVFKSMMATDFIKNIKETIQGPNRTLRNKGNCQDVVVYDPVTPSSASCSYIRLYHPLKNKKGGGSRVATITVSDYAQDLQISGSATSYTQEYDYTTQDEITKKIISSGVAAYEPLIGGDENPLRKPIAYGNKKEKLLVPNDKFYMEEPMGESFFPAATIGYSKVTVRNRAIEGVKRHATGSVVDEFYTARDFPTKTDLTGLKYKHGKTGAALRVLKIISQDFMTAAQGYMVELNDMHGKQKAQWVYAEGNPTAISGVEYKYKCSGDRLVNTATAIDAKGTILTANIGVDVDMVTDLREHTTDTKHFGLHGNLESFLAAIFPGLVPLFLPAFSNEQLRFRSAVTTKVVQRYGLVDQVIAHEGNSVVTTSNVAYDAETGEVMLTQVANEFEDSLYQFTYPAHWAYDNMGQAYKNTGLTHQLVFSNGSATVPNAKQLFTVGDELIFNKLAVFITIPKQWVTSVTDNQITVASAQPAGDAISGPLTFQVIRSGRRNQQGHSIGTISSLSNPLLDPANNNALRYYLDPSFTSQIVAASANEFSDQWDVFCTATASNNPYYAGSRGNWRFKKTATYLSDRKYDNVQKSRKTGSYTQFSPYWTLGVQTWTPQNTEDRWTSVNEIVHYDPYSGQGTEDLDPLKRSSSVVFGFNHTLPKLSISNSKYSQVYHESFEDDPVNRFEFDKQLQFPNPIETHVSHSGRNSKKVSGKDVILDLTPCK